MNYETVLVVTQRGSTTVLEPLPTGPRLELSVVTTGIQGPPGPAAPGSGSYDPGDLTVIFRNGLI